MPDPLSPSDRSSLAAEHGPINMAVGGAMVFERGRGVSYEAILGRLAERLHLIPRYRQRLEQPAFGLANPVWVDDEDFDLEWHVRRQTLPHPGGDAELSHFLGREFSRRLDRTRPLWELHVVEGLPRGQVAVVPKMHHALVDGIAAVGVGMILLDPTPEPMPVEAPAEPWQPQPYALSTHLRRLARGPMGTAQRLMVEGALRALDTSPRRAAGDILRSTELITELAKARPQAPMTVLNAEVSANRSYAIARVPLDAVKQIGRQGGGTVNDAVLAAVAGMLRRVFDEAGAWPAEGRDPVALVPVSVRRENDSELGNRISTVFVDLPVTEPDPVERVRQVSEAMSRIKGSAAVRAGAMMVGATGFAPPVVSSALVRALAGIRAFNLVVSNVPGPQQPFYMNGVRLREVFPVVPLNPANQGLTVGVVSYDGNVHFGLLADRRLRPGVERCALALEGALGELLGAAR